MKDVGMANVAYSYHWRVRTSNWPMFSLCTSSADWDSRDWERSALDDRQLTKLRTEISISLCWIFNLSLTAASAPLSPSELSVDIPNLIFTIA